MMIHNYNEPLPSYKSYKAEKFEKVLSKARAIRNSVHDLSLKDEDKKKLIELVIKEVKQ